MKKILLSVLCTLTLAACGDSKSGLFQTEQERNFAKIKQYSPKLVPSYSDGEYYAADTTTVPNSFYCVVFYENKVYRVVKIF